MLKISEVYEAERNDCRAALEKVDWKSETLAAGVFDVTCPSCSGALLRPVDEYKAYTDEMGLECRSCGNILVSSDFVPLAIEEALGQDKYLSYTDGGEDPYTTCPSCLEETYIMEERRCAHCGESVEHDCARCGNEIPASELMCSPLCGYCQHMTSKDD
jgi:ribosomal protein L37E